MDLLPVKRVRIPAPVDAHQNSIETGHLFVGDPPDLQVVEHLAAAAGGLAQVVVPVGPLVGVPHVLGLGDELRSQPLGRGLQVGRMVSQPVTSLLQRVPVHPAVPHDGRVVGLEVPKYRPAAHRRLEDVSYLVPPGELVQLLEVGHGDIPEGRLDALDLHGVVRAPEHDLLPGGLVDQLQRRDLRRPLLRHAQLADGPEVLAVNAVAQRGPHLAQHQRVDLRVQRQQQRHQQRDRAGFQAAPPAGQAVMGVTVIEHVPGDPVPGRTQQAGQPNRVHTSMTTRLPPSASSTGRSLASSL